MSDKDEPRLSLSVDGGKAMLYEFVLLCAFSPVMFTVCYTEAEHSIVCFVPELSSVLSRKVEHGLCRNTTLSSRVLTCVERSRVWPITLVVATESETELTYNQLQEQRNDEAFFYRLTSQSCTEPWKPQAQLEL